MIDGSQIYINLNQMLANGLDYDEVKIIFEIIRSFPTLRGLQIHVCANGCQDMFYLTFFAYESDHVCRTISHEIIHAVVDQVDGVKSSIALDRERAGLSLLDRLTNEGYLGGEC